MAIHQNFSSSSRLNKEIDVGFTMQDHSSVEDVPNTNLTNPSNLSDNQNLYFPLTSSEDEKAKSICCPFLFGRKKKRSSKRKTKSAKGDAIAQNIRSQADGKEHDKASPNYNVALVTDTPITENQEINSSPSLKEETRNTHKSPTVTCDSTTESPATEETNVVVLEDVTESDFEDKKIDKILEANPRDGSTIQQQLPSKAPKAENTLKEDGSSEDEIENILSGYSGSQSQDSNRIPKISADSGSLTTPSLSEFQMKKLKSSSSKSVYLDEKPSLLLDEETMKERRLRVNRFAKEYKEMRLKESPVPHTSGESLWSKHHMKDKDSKNHPDKHRASSNPGAWLFGEEIDQDADDVMKCHVGNTSFLNLNSKSMGEISPAARETSVKSKSPLDTLMRSEVAPTGESQCSQLHWTNGRKAKPRRLSSIVNTMLSSSDSEEDAFDFKESVRKYSKKRKRQRESKQRTTRDHECRDADSESEMKPRDNGDLKPRNPVEQKHQTDQINERKQESHDIISDDAQPFLETLNVNEVSNHSGAPEEQRLFNHDTAEEGSQASNLYQVERDVQVEHQGNPSQLLGKDKTFAKVDVPSNDGEVVHGVDSSKSKQDPSISTTTEDALVNSSKQDVQSTSSPSANMSHTSTSASVEISSLESKEGTKAQYYPEEMGMEKEVSNDVLGAYQMQFTKDERKVKALQALPALEDNLTLSKAQEQLKQNNEEKTTANKECCSDFENQIVYMNTEEKSKDLEQSGSEIKKEQEKSVQRKNVEDQRSVNGEALKIESDTDKDLSNVSVEVQPMNDAYDSLTVCNFEFEASNQTVNDCTKEDLEISSDEKDLCTVNEEGMIDENVRDGKENCPVEKKQVGLDGEDGVISLSDTLSSPPTFKEDSVQQEIGEVSLHMVECFNEPRKNLSVENDTESLKSEDEPSVKDYPDSNPTKIWVSCKEDAEDERCLDMSADRADTNNDEKDENQKSKENNLEQSQCMEDTAVEATATPSSERKFRMHLLDKQEGKELLDDAKEDIVFCSEQRKDSTDPTNDMSVLESDDEDTNSPLRFVEIIDNDFEKYPPSDEDDNEPFFDLYDRAPPSELKEKLLDLIGIAKQNTRQVEAALRQWCNICLGPIPYIEGRRLSRAINMFSHDSQIDIDLHLQDFQKHAMLANNMKDALDDLREKQRQIEVFVGRGKSPPPITKASDVHDGSKRATQFPDLPSVKSTTSKKVSNRSNFSRRAWEQFLSEKNAKKKTYDFNKLFKEH